jgi:transposase
MKLCIEQRLPIKKTFYASEQSSADFDEKLRIFVNSTARVPLENLVFLDEAGVNLAMCPRYGRSPNGKRLYEKKPARRAKNISLVGAMKHDGICALHPYDGPIDTKKFLHFVESILIPSLKAGDTLIMDNLRVHRVDIVRKTLLNAGINVIFLPPYCPQLNPIEEAWSVIKNLFRKMKSRTIVEIVNVVKKAKDIITRQKSYSFIKHAGYDPSFP